MMYVPVAGEIHSLAWIPKSIQKAGFVRGEFVPNWKDYTSVLEWKEFTLMASDIINWSSQENYIP